MRTLSALTLLAGSLFLTGCDIEIGDFGNSEKFQKDFRYSYPLKAGGTFSLETMNGSVDIAGWDRDEVEITGVKFGRTEALRDGIKIDVTHSDTAASVRTVGPYDNNSGIGARYVVRVPRKVTLDRIISSNGKVHVSDIDGPVNVKTSNSSIEAIKIGGAAKLHTSNSHIDAESVKGAIEATTSNSSINLTLNEGVSGGVRASTSNSSITVKIPGTTAARIRASTSNGSIHSDFEMGGGATEEKHHLEGMINGGTSSSPLVDLSTSNSSIHIVKL